MRYTNFLVLEYHNEIMLRIINGNIKMPTTGTLLYGKFDTDVF